MRRASRRAARALRGAGSCGPPAWNPQDRIHSRDGPEPINRAALAPPEGPGHDRSRAAAQEPPIPSRREFLGALALPAGALVLPTRLDPRATRRALKACAGLADAPEVSAADEALWFEVQQAYTVDRSQVNLNNGGVAPAPAVVQEAMQRHLDYSHELPAHNLWRVLEPQVEPVRASLARLFGCDAEEIAITRNASESLQICQLGFDLEPGDHVLTTTQDYPRMLATFRQRERREGLVLDTLELPVPCEDDELVVRRFEQALHERTRLILVSHMINITGQILPVRRVVEVGRRRGIPVIVDGAHAFAHLVFDRDALDCDYFGASLHKWLSAPHGTGMLYVRREKIGELWPLMAAGPEQREDIRKFEEIGTHPIANYLAIAEALAFHLGIGPARKEARLRYLRDHWARRMLGHERVVLHTSLDPRYSCGIATVELEGIDTTALQQHLWTKHRILTVGIFHEQFEGLRISPNVYTTLDELDRFAEALEHVLEHGLPT
jgi:selenocysteine lyase/cysteine desulfurase